MFESPHSEEEIEDQLNIATEQKSLGGSKFPAMTFEDGVDYALRWVLGESDDPPFEEDE